jgi:hypothetical protein
MMNVLPGTETSGYPKSLVAPLLGGAEIWPDEERRSRRNYRLSELDHHPKKTRVRFEFARRAHQRESTPKLGINRVLRVVKEKEVREWEIASSVA